jgi:nucleoside-diphosphate-sugar epimerase
LKILITGANGFVGRALCADLIKRDLAVVAAVREKANIVSGTPLVIGHINSATNWTEALSGVDVVIHLAARVHVMNEVKTDPLAEFRKVNVEGTLNLARQAALGGVKRFVFVSSIKVNGEETQSGKPFTTIDTPNPQDAYGCSKYEAEQGLLELATETGLEVVIIRPPLIYGTGVKANFASMIRAVKRGLPLPFGAIKNKRSFVYVCNLVSLIDKCIDHPAAVNQVFLVSDGHDLSTTELLCGSAKALGVRAMLLPAPQKLIELSLAVIGKKSVAQRLCGNLQVDITKARILLGWEPPFSVEQGLKSTALGLM